MRDSKPRSSLRVCGCPLLAARRPFYARARAIFFLAVFVLFAHCCLTHISTNTRAHHTHNNIKGPNAVSRAQVQSGRVITPNFGEVCLDPEPDQRLVRVC